MADDDFLQRLRTRPHDRGAYPVSVVDRAPPWAPFAELRNLEDRPSDAVEHPVAQQLNMANPLTGAVGLGSAVQDIGQAAHDNDWGSALAQGATLAAPFAKGIFAGPMARLPAAQRAMGNAAEAQAKGATFEQAWLQHGAGLGPKTESPFYEIDDRPLKVSPTFFRDTRGVSIGSLQQPGALTGRTARVGDVIDHPELFEAYPHLRDLRAYHVTDGDPSFQAAYMPDDRALLIGKQWATENPSQLRAAAAHELQHGVDHFEGRDFGSSPALVAGIIRDGNNPGVARLYDQHFRDIRRSGFPADFARQEALVKTYAGNEGEVRAGLVERRLGRTPEQRRAMVPVIVDSGWRP